MSPVKTAPAELTAGDAALRTQYLAEVLALLYPAPCDTDGRRRGEPIAEYLVVPDARRPRLLVPNTSRRVAAAAVRRYAEPQSRGRPAQAGRGRGRPAHRRVQRAAARPDQGHRAGRRRASTGTCARRSAATCR